MEFQNEPKTFNEILKHLTGYAHHRKTMTLVLQKCKTKFEVYFYSMLTNGTGLAISEFSIFINWGNLKFFPTTYKENVDMIL